MKINGSKGLSASSSAAPQRASGSGFALGGTGGVAAASGAQVALGVSAVGSLDALIALQEIDGPLGRRRRAIGRANRLLDELDDLKLALLDGEVDEGGLRRLSDAVRQQRESTSDPGLDALLDQIEARAAVELAKLEVALQAA